MTTANLGKRCRSNQEDHESPRLALTLIVECGPDRYTSGPCSPNSTDAADSAIVADTDGTQSNASHHVDWRHDHDGSCPHHQVTPDIPKTIDNSDLEPHRDSDDYHTLMKPIPNTRQTPVVDNDQVDVIFGCGTNLLSTGLHLSLLLLDFFITLLLAASRLADCGIIT